MLWMLNTNACLRPDLRVLDLPDVPGDEEPKAAAPVRLEQGDVIHGYISMCVYIYIYRERESEIICIYIYIYIASSKGIVARLFRHRRNRSFSKYNNNKTQHHPHEPLKHH